MKPRLVLPCCVGKEDLELPMLLLHTIGLTEGRFYPDLSRIISACRWQETIAELTNGETRGLSLELWFTL